MVEAVYDSLAMLEASIQEMGYHTPEYFDKMMHKVPCVPSVERTQWLITQLIGKTLLHIGCIGPLHEQLLKVCTKAYGIDRESARYSNYVCLDIETMRMPLPKYDGVQVVLLGEVLEHLLAPGLLLKQVKMVYPEIPVIITVPNAGSEALQANLRRGYESVNRDHVAWYSWKTLKTLVERCGYEIQQFYWYGGKPLFAEGLIFVVN